MAIKQLHDERELTLEMSRASGHKRSFWGPLWRAKVAYLMLAGTFAFLLVFQYYPAFMGLYRSLFIWSAGLPGEFVGLANFVQLFTEDNVFLGSLKNLALLAAWYLVSTLATSIGVAVLLHRLKSQGAKYFFRLFMVLPVIIPGIVFIFLWVFIYDATIGPLNALLTALGLESWTHAWLGDPRTALYAVMFRNFPWIDGVAVLIILAGFQAIPSEIIDSGRIDGADGLKQLWFIELPLIAGQIKLISVLTLIFSVQEFSAIFAMTRGGPINATQVPGMWMYYNAFYLGKMGYASAIGVVMFLLTLVLTSINLRYIKTQEF